MNSGPSRLAEALTAVLIPPACREEVLGDLHERFQSPLRYAVDVFRTVPFVILSRARRATEPQVLLIQALAAYMAFLAAAWLDNGAVLTDRSGMLRLAIPVAIAMLGLILDDTYALRTIRSAADLARGPLLSGVMTLTVETVLRMNDPDIALARWTAWYGCAAGGMLSFMIRLLFRATAKPVSPGAAETLQQRKDDRMAMSTKQKIAIACGAILLLAAMTWAVTTHQRSVTTYTYSHFLTLVRGGKLAGVVIFDNNSGAAAATCSLKDGNTGRTVLPANYKDALRAMQEQLVNVEIRGGSAEVQLVKATPFLLLLALWIILLIAKFPPNLNRGLRK